MGRDPSVLSEYCGVLGCALEGRTVDGYEDGESTVVRGVRRLCEFLTEFMAVCRVDMLLLKTEELELACELADPTVFKVSPGSDSLSSGVGCAASKPEPLR